MSEFLPAGLPWPIMLDMSELCLVPSFCHVSNITCLISELFGNWFVCGSGQWYFYGFRAYASQTRWQKWLKQWYLFRQVMFLTLSGSPWSLLYIITWLNFIRSRDNENDFITERSIKKTGLLCFSVLTQNWSNWIRNLKNNLKFDLRNSTYIFT